MAHLSVQSLPRTEVIKVELLNEPASYTSSLWVLHIDVAREFLRQRKRFPSVVEDPADSPYRCSVCEGFTHSRGNLYIVIEELVTVAESGRCGGCSMIYHALHAEVFQQQIDELSHLWLESSTDNNYPSCFLLADEDGKPVYPWYELFIPKGTVAPWKGIPIRPTKSGSTSSQQALSWARGKIHHCQTQHKTCSAGFASQLPARILDIRNMKLGEGQRDGFVKLYSPEKEVAPYVCLSHCWGTNQPLRTTRDNVDEFHHSISWVTLPKTFQDAVLVTAELVQDDENDWRVESAKMASIYQGSVVTLAASASVDSAGGLFYNCSSQDVDKLIQVGENNKPVFGIRRSAGHRDVLGDDKGKDSSTLLTRAWVFQERLLAPRFLHFGSRELILECAEETTCECGDSIISTFVPTPKLEHRKAMMSLKEDGVIRYWRQIVHEYSKLNLSFPTDRLPALAGLAKQIAGLRSDSYLAGLWEDSLLQDLLWTRSGGPMTPYEESYKPKNALQKFDRRFATITSSKRGVPTWSWARLSGPVDFRKSELLPSSNGVCCSLIEAECVNDGGDAFGRVLSGYICLHGTLVPVTYEIEVTSHIANIDFPNPEKVQETKHLIKNNQSGGVSGVDLDYILYEGFPSLYFLPVIYSANTKSGLVLRKYEGFDQVFERVGIVTYAENIMLEDDLKEKTTVTII
ncbi:hypothetical protein B0O99DRAFT_671731 [Bisporella sp. PMI_857]|nr:hypothetical protein B0O99DRAFT_671731 [Bisporella sp. PMI_857]